METVGKGKILVLQLSDEEFKTLEKVKEHYNETSDLKVIIHCLAHSLIYEYKYKLARKIVIALENVVNFYRKRYGSRFSSQQKQK